MKDLYEMNFGEIKQELVCTLDKLNFTHMRMMLCMARTLDEIEEKHRHEMYAKRGIVDEPAANENR
ncbi:MAG: hypothetical protein ACI3VS_06330 [Evtepia sp.]